MCRAHSSELAEDGDVDGLDDALEGLLDSLANSVSRDLLVDDGGTDAELLHTEGNGLELELGLPGETLLVDLGDDVAAELVEVGLSVDDLDVPDDEGLANGGLLGELGGGGLLLHLLGSGGSISVISSIEQVVPM